VCPIKSLEEDGKRRDGTKREIRGVKNEFTSSTPQFEGRKSIHLRGRGGNSFSYPPLFKNLWSM
jgi:hypothetical protein